MIGKEAEGPEYGRKFAGRPSMLPDWALDCGEASPDA